MNEALYAAIYGCTLPKSKHPNPPNLQKAGQYAGRLQGLHDVHQKGDLVAAQKVWQRIIKDNPEIASHIKTVESMIPVHISQLEDTPPRRPLYKQVLMPQSLAAIYGSSGGGKTFVSIHMAMQVALQGIPVVYIVAEGATGYNKRIKAYCQTYKLERENIPIEVISIAVNLSDAAVIEILNTILEEMGIKPGLIVFDTLARCAGDADENSSTDMGKIVQNADYFIREYGATVLLVHHPVKGGTCILRLV